MQKLMFLGLGLCLLSACSESWSISGSSTGSSTTSTTSSSTSSSTVIPPSAPDGERSLPPTVAAAGTDAKVELADHAQLIERVKQAKGRVVVVDVWSTSCVPCMREFPHLVELARRWPEDVVCISMNVDYLGLPNTSAQTNVPKVTEFLNSQTAAPDNLWNLVSSEADTDVLSKLEIESMPAIIVTDRAGQQVAKLTTDSAGADGLTYAGDVLPLVEKLIEHK